VKTVYANYFDGQSARRQPVTLRFAHDQLEVRGAELIRAEPLSNVRISAKLGSAPRLLYFAGGAHCEVNNHVDFEALLLEAGLAPQSLLSRLEHSWRHALTATFFFYRHRDCVVLLGLALDSEHCCYADSGQRCTHHRHAFPGRCRQWPGAGQQTEQGAAKQTEATF
jgi:hypothetical protein